MNGGADIEIGARLSLGTDEFTANLDATQAAVQQWSQQVQATDVVVNLSLEVEEFFQDATAVDERVGELNELSIEIPANLQLDGFRDGSDEIRNTVAELNDLSVTIPVNYVVNGDPSGGALPGMPAGADGGAASAPFAPVGASPSTGSAPVSPTESPDASGGSEDSIVGDAIGAGAAVAAGRIAAGASTTVGAVAESAAAPVAETVAAGAAGLAAGAKLASSPESISESISHLLKTANFADPSSPLPAAEAASAGEAAAVTAGEAATATSAATGAAAAGAGTAAAAAGAGTTAGAAATGAGAAGAVAGGAAATGVMGMLRGIFPVLFAARFAEREVNKTIEEVRKENQLQDSYDESGDPIKIAEKQKQLGKVGGLRWALQKIGFTSPIGSMFAGSGNIGDPDDAEKTEEQAIDQYKKTDKHVTEKRREAVQQGKFLERLDTDTEKLNTKSDTEEGRKFEAEKDQIDVERGKLTAEYQKPVYHEGLDPRRPLQPEAQANLTAKMHELDSRLNKLETDHETRLKDARSETIEATEKAEGHADDAAMEQYGRQLNARYMNLKAISTTEAENFHEKIPELMTAKKNELTDKRAADTEHAQDFITEQQQRGEIDRMRAGGDTEGAAKLQRQDTADREARRLHEEETRVQHTDPTRAKLYEQQAQAVETRAAGAEKIQDQATEEKYVDEQIIRQAEKEAADLRKQGRRERAEIAVRDAQDSVKADKARRDNHPEQADDILDLESHQDSADLAREQERLEREQKVAERHGAVDAKRAAREATPKKVDRSQFGLSGEEFQKEFQREIIEGAENEAKVKAAAEAVASEPGTPSPVAAQPQPATPQPANTIEPPASPPVAQASAPDWRMEKIKGLREQVAEAPAGPEREKAQKRVENAEANYAKLKEIAVDEIPGHEPVEQPTDEPASEPSAAIVPLQATVVPAVAQVEPTPQPVPVPIAAQTAPIPPAIPVVQPAPVSQAPVPQPVAAATAPEVAAPAPAPVTATVLTPATPQQEPASVSPAVQPPSVPTVAAAPSSPVKSEPMPASPVKVEPAAVPTPTTQPVAQKSAEPLAVKTADPKEQPVDQPTTQPVAMDILPTVPVDADEMKVATDALPKPGSAATAPGQPTSKPLTPATVPASPVPIETQPATADSATAESPAPVVPSAPAQAPPTTQPTQKPAEEPTRATEFTRELHDAKQPTEGEKVSPSIQPTTQPAPVASPKPTAAQPAAEPVSVSPDGSLPAALQNPVEPSTPEVIHYAKEHGLPAGSQPDIDSVRSAMKDKPSAKPAVVSRVDRNADRPAWLDKKKPASEPKTRTAAVKSGPRPTTQPTAAAQPAKPKLAQKPPAPKVTGHYVGGGEAVQDVGKSDWRMQKIRELAQAARKALPGKDQDQAEQRVENAEKNYAHQNNTTLAAVRESAQQISDSPREAMAKEPERHFPMLDKIKQAMNAHDDDPYGFSGPKKPRGGQHGDDGSQDMKDAAKVWMDTAKSFQRVYVVGSST